MDHCPFGDDEEHCKEDDCRMGAKRCGDICLSKREQCNGELNCEDGSDEMVSINLNAIAEIAWFFGLDCDLSTPNSEKLLKNFLHIFNRFLKKFCKECIGGLDNSHWRNFFKEFGPFDLYKKNSLIVKKPLV